MKQERGNGRPEPIPSCSRKGLGQMARNQIESDDDVSRACDQISSWATSAQGRIDELEKENKELEERIDELERELDLIKEQS